MKTVKLTINLYGFKKALANLIWESKCAYANAQAVIKPLIRQQTLDTIKLL